MKKSIFLVFIFFLTTSTTFAGLDLSKQYSHAKVQSYSLSCEYSALSAILTKISGKTYSEDFLINKSPKDWFGKPAIMKNKIRYWGNPEIGFVGKINESHQFNYTGYWIYEKPLKKLVNSLGFSAKTLNKKEYIIETPKSHLTALLREIESWNWVFLLADWCTDPQYDDGQISTKLTNAELQNWLNQKNTCKYWQENRIMKWKTLENWKEIDFVGLSGDHAFILTGYEWIKENPTHIRVFDTNTGFHKYPINEWMRKWWKMDNRSLVIYKQKNDDLFGDDFAKIDDKNIVEKEINIVENQVENSEIQSNSESELLKTLPMSIYNMKN